MSPLAQGTFVCGVEVDGAVAGTAFVQRLEVNPPAAAVAMSGSTDWAARSKDARMHRPFGAWQRRLAGDGTPAWPSVRHGMASALPPSRSQADSNSQGAG